MLFKINLLDRNCNRNRNKNQFSFLFNSFTKNDWIKELTDVDSNLYLLIKEEVEEFFYKTGGYLTYLDFEACYNLAVEATIRQVKKSIRKKKKCFFENNHNCNDLIYYKIKQRLLNNIKNLFDLNRKINVLNVETWIINNIYENFEIDTTLWELEKLSISNSEIIIDNIIKLAKSFEIALTEVEELSLKLDIDTSNFNELNLSLQFKNFRKDANNQTYLSFEIEDFEEVA